MHLIYFDENKYATDNPFFFIGGILVEDKKLSELENAIMQIQYEFFGTNLLNKNTELHGVELFHGKKNFKGRKLKDRLDLFKNIIFNLISYKVPTRIVCIDVSQHRSKYCSPDSEYNLGLMFLLEKFCDYLENVDDIGIVFGDYEKDEVTRSILGFSQFKHDGKYLGHKFGRLKDTIHFTHSHHSRFLQIADLIIYMAGRLENNLSELTKWHDIELQTIWRELKEKTDFYIQKWPVQQKRSDQSQLRRLALRSEQP